MPLVNFVKEVKGHISIVVEITPNAPFDPFNLLNMHGDLALVITGATAGKDTNTHQGSTLKLPGGWRGATGQTLKWTFASSAPSMVPPPTTPIANEYIGTLSDSLLEWKGGICSWESIGLKRFNNAGGGYQPGEMEPLRGTITVQYMPPDPAQPGKFLSPFVFAVRLAPFEREENNNNAWKTLLGARFGSFNNPWWTGPL
ncbi:hypothetical protein M434DRAFT_395659 [Hypoxylon sp. CO27-5]|nr:hypothetical protein M434DRAFT_395659 [Hypoxylon sp. CO27-5]